MQRQADSGDPSPFLGNVRADFSLRSPEPTMLRRSRRGLRCLSVICTAAIAHAFGFGAILDLRFLVWQERSVLSAGAWCRRICCIHRWRRDRKNKTCRSNVLGFELDFHFGRLRGSTAYRDSGLVDTACARFADALTRMYSAFITSTAITCPRFERDSSLRPPTGDS